MPSKPQRPGGRLARAALCSLLFIAVGSLPVFADTLGQADTSRAARENAVRSIPLDQMTREAQSRIQGIISRPSIYRRLPTQRIACDSDMHLFLLRHPEVIVNMWAMMGLTKLEIERTDPYQVRAADGVGTICDVELIYGTPKLHVIYARSSYEGTVFRRKINADSVFLVRTHYSRGPDNQILVTNTLDAFVQFDGLATELLAKTVQSLITKAADHNFAEAMRFMSRINDAAEKNGPGVQRLSERLEQVDPGVRRQFAQVAHVVHQRAVMREASQQVSESTRTASRASAGAGE